MAKATVTDVLITKSGGRSSSVNTAKASSKVDQDSQTQGSGTSQFPILSPFPSDVGSSLSTPSLRTISSFFKNISKQAVLMRQMGILCQLPSGETFIRFCMASEGDILENWEVESVEGEAFLF